MISTYLKRSDGTMTLLEMRIDDSGRPFVNTAARPYSSMAELSAAYPELCTTGQLPLCCRLYLHFMRGFGFILIDDPDEFRQRYATLLRHGNAAAGDRPSTADFGPFDTTEISHPQLAKDQLVFYVEGNPYAVPYRVEAPWPHHAQGVVKFLLLPQQD